MTLPESQSPARHVRFANNARPTEVWFVQGKKANRAFKAALNRENATLSEKTDLDPPPRNDEAKDSQRHIPEEEGHNDGRSSDHVCSNPR